MIELFKNTGKHWPQDVGAVCTIAPRREFIHIGALRQFHLDDMDAIGWIGIVARSPAAPETAIQDSVGIGRGTADFMCRRLD